MMGFSLSQETQTERIHTYHVTIYSATVVDNAKVGSFLEFQVTGSPLKPKEYPVYEHLSSKDAPQSASA